MRLHQQFAQSASMAVIGRVLGLVRDSLIAGLLGIGSTLDIYTSALALPTVFTNILQAVHVSVLLPRMVRAQSSEDPTEFGRLFTETFLRIFIFAAIFAAAAIPLSGYYVSLVVSGYGPAKAAETAGCFAIVLMSMPLTLSANVMQSALFSHKKFALGSQGQILSALVMVGVLIAFHDSIADPKLLVVAHLATQFLGWILLVLLCLRFKYFAKPGQGWFSLKPDKDANHMTLATITLQGLPLLDQKFGSQLGPGMVSSLAYGLRIPDALWGLMNTSISSVMGRHYSLEAVQKRLQRPMAFWKDILASLAVTVPITAALILASPWLCRLIYGHREVTPEAIAMVSQIQGLYSLALPAMGLGLVCNQLLKAIGRYNVMLWTSILTVSVKAIVLLVGIRYGVMALPASIILALSANAVSKLVAIHYSGIPLLPKKKEPQPTGS